MERYLGINAMNSNREFENPSLDRIVTEPSFFRAVFDAIPLQIVVKSAREEDFGKFLIWNKAAENSLGIPASEAIGRTDTAFFPPEQVAFFLEKDREVIASRRQTDISSELIESRKDGRRILHTVKTPIFSSTGEPLAILAVSEDVTEKMRAQGILETVARHFPGAFFQFKIDREGNRSVPFISEGASKIYDIPAREIMRVHGILENLVLQEDRGEVEAHLMKSRESLSDLVCEFRIHTPTGATKWLRADSEPQLQEDGSIVWNGSVTDITDRKCAEMELREALEFLRNVNSQLPGAIYRFRIDREEGMAFPYISEGIKQLSGDDPSDIMEGKINLLSRVLPDDSTVFLAAISKSRRMMEPCHQQFRLVHRDGSVRWAMSNSIPMADGKGGIVWHGFVMDITELKSATSELLRNETRLGLALEATHAAAWEITPEGEVVLTEQWRNLFGFARHECPKTPAEGAALIHAEDRRKFADIFRDEGVYMPRDFSRLEVRHRKKDGTYMWVMLSSKVLRDATGKILRTVGTILDISERKALEESLRKAKEEAEHASKAKSDFLAVMSHEIRTPLNGVLGCSELLSKTPLSASQKDYLRTIKDCSGTLLVFMNDLLDFANFEAGRIALDLKPCDLRETLIAAVDIFRFQAQTKGIELIVTGFNSLPASAVCDAARLRQALQNLVGNAVKFTERGAVRVEAHSTPAGGRRHMIELCVRDSGIGVDERDLARIFQPFYQSNYSVRRHFGGAGIGLAVVKRIVEAMGGSIKVESKLGEGSCFRIFLTCETGSSIQADESPRQPVIPSSELSGVRALLVEDNAINRKLFRIMLERLGVEFDEAENGVQGVEKVAANDYDIVFMDIQMPEMDGYEATRRIRDLETDTNKVVIVAMTAHAMPEDRARCMAAGMDDYLTKPARIEDIRNTLKKFVVDV